ncbi:MAG TPA: glutamine-hydrolyzing GMP synthase [Pyrinomonadaceae bacterium]|nr:glutamine-hydrolyzing GMP synthase [Pyrinomonadaceae bacterium]
MTQLWSLEVYFLTIQTQHETVIILDFGSQYTQLIARRVREAGVYCEILPFNTPIERIVARRPKGLILSGSPASVYAEGAPRPDSKILQAIECPLLGICYGLQILAFDMGGHVESSPNREFGYARLKVVDNSSSLFEGMPAEMDVWMSHGDQMTTVPTGFSVTALTDDALNAIEDTSRNIYGVQFHPEVAHTPLGAQLLRNFLFSICKCRGDWSPKAVIEEQTARIRETVGTTGRVVSGLSGGVDSTVAAALVHRAIGDRQTCIFVDNGLLREGEFESTLALLHQRMQLNISGVRAGKQFLEALDGVSDPEEKRKRIGKVFIEVFEHEALKVGEVAYLVQGTLYPDVIESVSVRGPSAVIKSHHNVGGLPEKMHLKLIEPLRELFKDEVRLIGRELGVPEEILTRHPFPGPGLAVRIIGEVTEDRVRLVQSADRILDEELRAANLYDSVWQAFPVLLPVSTVGVMGDERTYEKVIALRAVTSVDGMTADWARLPHDLLARVSSRIISEIRGVNRVVYDISSKPPSTIEWE